MHQKLRRIVAALTIAASLAVPGQVFAATDTGETAESLSVAATISAVFPATATYIATADQGLGDGSPDFTTGQQFVTVVSSNNPSGMTITAQVDPWSQGPINVGTNRRFTALLDYPGHVGDPGLPGSGADLTKVATTLPEGTFATSASIVTLASSTGALANADLGVEFIVDSDYFTVGGDYTSAVHYVAATNP